MTEDWSRPAPPPRDRRPAAHADETVDPWTVRLVSEQRLRSPWWFTPFDGGEAHRLWRSGGLVTVATQGGSTVAEGTATGAAVEREWAPWALVLAYMLMGAGLWAVTDTGDLVARFAVGALFAGGFAVSALRTPMVRLDYLDVDGQPRVLRFQPSPRRFGRHPEKDSHALAELLRADAIAAHPLATRPGSTDEALGSRREVTPGQDD